MKTKHPFFRMGLFGLIATLSMHLGFALTGIAGINGSLAVWSSCYAVWLTFLVLGLALARRGGDDNAAPGSAADSPR